MKQLIYIILFTLLSPVNYLSACTIFTSSLKDAILVGNNEDMCTTNTIIQLIPSSENNYGRILWGFKGDENYQGGMNQYGLFFDGASTPPVKMTGWNMPEFKHGDGYIFETVLEKCKTVQEAIDFISPYSLPYLKFCHILLADASGDAAIVEWGNNKLNFIRKGDKNFLIATNFNITESKNPEKECQRYSTAEKMLSQSEPTVELFKNILSLTHVEGKFPTVYSNVCDLKNRKIYLYNFHNYSFCKEIDLNKELSKGEKQYMIRSFFPANTSELMFRMMNDCIDDFENVPTKNVTFKIILNKPFDKDSLFIRGGAKELGDWDEPGIKLDRINDNEFEKTIPFKEGKMFDFSVSNINDDFIFFDQNMEAIRETTIEVKADTIVSTTINAWKKKE